MRTSPTYWTEVTRRLDAERGQHHTGTTRWLELTHALDLARWIILLNAGRIPNYKPFRT